VAHLSRFTKDAAFDFFPPGSSGVFTFNFQLSTVNLSFLDSRSLAAPFHQKHVEGRVQSLNAKLPNLLACLLHAKIPYKRALAWNPKESSPYWSSRTKRAIRRHCSRASRLPHASQESRHPYETRAWGHCTLPGRL